jgi:hypothetical protein
VLLLQIQRRVLGVSLLLVAEIFECLCH